MDEPGRRGQRHALGWRAERGRAGRRAGLHRAGRRHVERTWAATTPWSTTAGTDHLLAGTGNDLLLSIISCRGDELNGGGDRDNASWARLTTSVEASLATGRAGAPGASGPQCASGSLASLAEIEDLEGSSFADTLSGDSGPNQLLGRAGGDTFRGAEGSDLLLTNAGDFDPLISCGADTDIALIDHPLYGETPDPDCESLQEADPKYAG